jgi:hypothetical protein
VRTGSSARPPRDRRSSELFDPDVASSLATCLRLQKRRISPKHRVVVELMDLRGLNGNPRAEVFVDPLFLCGGRWCRLLRGDVDRCSSDITSTSAAGAANADLVMASIFCTHAQTEGRRGHSRQAGAGCGMRGSMLKHKQSDTNDEFPEGGRGRRGPDYNSILCAATSRHSRIFVLRPPTTIRASALQFVRKLSGMNKPLGRMRTRSIRR